MKQQIRISLRGGPRGGMVYLIDPDIAEVNIQDINMNKLSMDHDVSEMSDQEFNKVAKHYSTLVGKYKITDRLDANGNIIFEYQED